ncbi:hypothetical protein [Shewanella algae]|uniref:hypothetical protein n=1 Tax=Shewanella algae TaxID=38313 RepID=UPI001AAC5FBB|nr:hypothetical protein [Shewanella algae]MBO2615337.1 hypothetical protein [Shewanella algae]
MMKVRLGLANDVEWISKLLIDGANEGHYLPTIKSKAKELVQSVVANGGVQMVKLRSSVHAPVFVQMDLTVAEIDGIPASFLICCRDADEVEIHLAGTLKKFRKKGCFNRLVSEAIRNYSGSRIYARCYKKSSWAINGLESINFKVTKDGNPIEMTYAGAA